MDEEIIREEKHEEEKKDSERIINLRLSADGFFDKQQEQELIEKVEKAASKGAKKGGVAMRIVSLIIVVAIVLGALYYFKMSMDTKWEELKSQFAVEEPAEEHDEVLEDDGIFGYTAADFGPVILGDAQRVAKIEILTRSLSEDMTITDAGFAKWKVFSKTKKITYNGTVVYTIDLSTLSQQDITYDDEMKVLTITIPHAQQEKINIPSDEIKFESTKKGILAFKDIKLTPEQNAELQNKIVERMEQKLLDERVLELADDYAIKVVSDMFTPLIRFIEPEVTVKIVFR